MRSRDWLLRNKKDIYIEKAKKAGYLSRSAYKLIEIENKYKIISNSSNILELGSAPGGWSQVICNINRDASIHAFDLLNMDYKNVKIKFFKKNFLEFNFEKLYTKYDLILSDIAPNTVGHKSTDHLRIAALIEEMIYIVEKNITMKGNFVFKLWHGSQENIIISLLNKKFKKISNFKPHSSRKESSEIYVIAQNFIG